ncbi:UPF0716 family protein affecting phage T7 exclusion [Trueperella bonasi]|uniref:UPF0716 family protein affecting phage T7 exclusion n=1 Tax=Trueperella bonasi TaxID=312286 RepID=A0ABT9NEB7_9ACTO|nr:DUF2975 domain-containing protein [Trueperella bonasi]MDP9805732.1 UPF0716 family protein affecting phage T7 exclusion [Trueperella bonasi]
MPTSLYRITLATLGLFILGLLFGQILVPISAKQIAFDFPEVSHLVDPYSVLGVLTLLCFQIAFVLIGILLRHSKHERFFSDSSRKVIKAIASAATLGCLIPVATAIHLFATIHAGGPAVMLGALASATGAIGLFCLGAIAVRAFDHLRAEHDELEAVI